jgi:hypothetical protein
MSPASISHKDEEVAMGRTKHRLPPRNKSEREFDHEIGNIVFVLNAIDAGRLDHLFVDAETKAAVRADWAAKGEAVVRKYARRIPGFSMRRRYDDLRRMREVKFAQSEPSRCNFN